MPYDKIPAFKAAYDCYRECLFRLRNVPGDAKPTANDIKRSLMAVMVNIVHARLNMRVLESLREAVDLAIAVQITLRVLVETNALSKKDFAFVSQYSDNLVRQMVGWSSSYEEKTGGNGNIAAAGSQSGNPVCPDLFAPQQ